VSSTGTTTTPSAQPTSGRAAGFPGKTICAAVPASQVQKVLPGASGQGKPAELQRRVHACSWLAPDGKLALVAIVFDNRIDKDFVDDELALANRAAGTHFPVSINTNFDQGARNVAVFILGKSLPLPSIGKAGAVEGTVGDLIYNTDHGLHS
jgi:hypothetical protein